MKRRTAICFAIPSAWALLSLSSLPALAQSGSRLPLGTAINRAGKMRAMSQRVSKAYVQGYQRGQKYSGPWAVCFGGGVCCCSGGESR